MKILILEDEDDKYKEIHEHISQIISEFTIQRVENWLNYSAAIHKTKFDLILLDLLVPRSPKDNIIEDHHEQLVETTRDYESNSFFTPAIVLTRHSLDNGDFVHDLNKVNINVITYNDHGDWKEALKIKLLAAQPKKSFEFVIVCALDKEANAFKDFTDTWSDIKTIDGLCCREVQIGGYKGAIVVAHRMGLVASAVVATMALDLFKPRLICMSGICGGVPKESKVYDLLITQSCFQHDIGKWTNEGFKSEHYDAPIDTDVHNKLIELCDDSKVKEFLVENLNPAQSEFPKGIERIEIKIECRAATSSGSAVIAESGKTSTLSAGQRKLVGFDMEIYSVYEAARHSIHKPVFFAAKVVVDDGDKNKGDKFHRIGCIVSAKFIVKAIQSGLADEAFRKS